jgi:LysM repeat protein
MKSQTIPIKRRPAPKGIFKRLSAVTRSRKQRVAATASAEDFETEDSSSRISRALTIIFLVHIFAIGLIFFHQYYLDGRTPSGSGEAKAAQATATPAAAAATPRDPRANLPRLSSGDTPYIVRAGDNYARIAAAHSVDESDLRLLNRHVEIGPGLILKIPPARAVVEDPVATAPDDPVIAAADSGLVEALPADGSIPRAQMVRPNIGQPAADAPAATGRSYVVQSGDTIWRIANRYKVDQDALMRANNITDARRVRVGMTLVIP